MFPPKFDYYRPDSVDETIDLLDQHQDQDAKILAGGHSLIPMMKQRLAQPDILIDIDRLGSLSGVESAGDRVEIGPLTSHAQLERSSLLQEKAPCLSQAAGEIGDVQVRNRGTIGGNLAHADPSSDLPAPFLALGGEVEVRGPEGARTISADNFFFGLFTTDLAENELITKLSVPVNNDLTDSSYVKKASPSSGYAMVGVAAVVTLDDGVVQEARFCANGVLNYPCRLTAVEEALVGKTLDHASAEKASESSGSSLDETQILSDMQASADYRKSLLQVYTRRAILKLNDLDLEESKP